MRIYIALLLIIYFTNNLKAQESNLYILDSVNNIPVPFVLVCNEQGATIYTSDENGYIDLSQISKKTNTISISCIGFQTKKVLLHSLNFSNKSTSIYLKRKVVSLTEITINSATNLNIFKSINALDIHLRPINNSQEVLRMVPGLFIGQHAGGGKAEQLFLRGFDLDHGTDINISVDGMPVNMVSHAHGQGYADLHFVIPELIDKVNFNKGPYFVDKGNFTTAGFVEFRSKDYLEKNFVKVETGQFNTFRGIVGINLLDVNKNKRNQNLYFAGEGTYSRGYFDVSQQFNRFNGILKYHGKLNNKNSLTASITAFTSKWNASGQIPERSVSEKLIGFFGAIDSNEGGKTSRYNMNVEMLTHIKNGGVIRNQLYYSKYYFELYSNFTFFKEDSINGDQIKQKENRDILGYNNSFVNEFYLGKIKIESKMGVQIRNDIVNDVELSRTIDRTLKTNEINFGKVNELNLGLYYSHKISISDKLDISPGLRMDHFINSYYNKISDTFLSSNSTIFCPKINFNYRINENIQLYFYNGRGFHSNDSRVAVNKNGKKVLPPAYGTDLGGIFKLGKKFFLQTALWYLWLDQEFIYVGDEGVVEAGGQSRRFGLDISMRYELIKNLYVDIDMNFADPKAIGVDNDKSYLPLAPIFTNIGGLTYRKKTGWNGSIRYRYMANRPANESYTVIAFGYLIFDAALNFTTKNWEAGISIQNLFNTKWKETQFETESRLKNEPKAVSEIHFTPGTPFFAKFNFIAYFGKVK